MKRPKVLHEDAYVLVLDKPAGMVVNRADTVADTTLQDWIEDTYRWSIFKFRECRSGVVHRLDKDTSGVMVVAKTRAAFVELQRQFHDREVHKRYVALVHGYLTPSEGSLRVPLGRMRSDRKKFGVVVGGRISETGYQVLGEYTKHNYSDGFSLVELMPKTGRTHQLRVVLKHLGHPIVGDGYYLSKKRRKADAAWCGRQFLHARRLEFVNPGSGKRGVFESELADDLAAAMKGLEAR